MDELDIDAMAREAGLAPSVSINDTPALWSGSPEDLRYFARLLMYHCANIAASTYEGGTPNSEDGDSGYDFMGANSADEIRKAADKLVG